MSPSEHPPFSRHHGFHAPNVAVHVVPFNLSDTDEQSGTVGHAFRLYGDPALRLGDHLCVPADAHRSLSCLLTHPDFSLSIASQKSNFQLWPFQLGPQVRHLHKRNSQLRLIQLQTGTYPQVELFTGYGL